MNDSSKKLEENINNMCLMYSDNKNADSVQKIKNYKLGKLILKESNMILDEMIHNIRNVTLTEPDSNTIDKIDEYMKLASNLKMNFPELMYVYSQLLSINDKQYDGNDILSGLENDVIYDEDIVSTND